VSEALAKNLTAEIPEWAAGELPSTWKTAGRGWGHRLHKLSPYVGGFPAQLARFFVLNLSEPGQTVYDPFSGGGTTVLEALLCGREAVASDAFEYAYVLTHAKARPMRYGDFAEYLRARIVEAASLAEEPPLDNDDLRVFFSEHTLAQLVRLRAVLVDDASPEATFTKAAICGVLHGPSKMFLSAPQKDQTSSTVEYVRRYLERHGIERPRRDVYDSAMNKAGRSGLDVLPHRTGRAYRADARDTPLPSESVDLIVTSPPYMAVLDYSWNNWLRLWWLGKDRLEERGKLILSRREDVYRDFMRDSMAEMYRVLRRDSAAVIVVGDVKTSGKNGRPPIINSALLLAEEAVKVGFDVECIVDDVYRLNARSMLVLNSLKWGYSEHDHARKSSVLIDRCLVLRKGDVSWRRPAIDWTNPGPVGDI
jgi:DNA methylase